MSRSGYSEDCDNLGLWRGAVRKAVTGKRGKAFLQEMLDALDALPQKRLITQALQDGCEVCAIGSVGLKRGMDMSKMDVTDHELLGEEFGIARVLVAEIEFVNDDDFGYNRDRTPEQRFERVRNWVSDMLSGGDPG
jgi:D-lyxose ketol-isomerase